MGFREWFNKHPKITYGAIGACLLVAVGMVVTQVLANRHTYPSKLPDAYYTVDDGKTYFIANSSNQAPFDYKGKTAVHAYVFKSDKGNVFVGLLERYNADVIKALNSGKPMTPEMARFGRELKHPSETTWVKSGEPATESKMSNITAPDGSAVAESVEP